MVAWLLRQDISIVNTKIFLTTLQYNTEKITCLKDKDIFFSGVFSVPMLLFYTVEENPGM
jgi:hypothetical protein